MRRNLNFARSLLVLALLGYEGTTVAQESSPPAVAPFNADQAKAFQQQWAKHIGKEPVYTNSIGMKLTLLPPGEFVMGVSEKDVFRELRQNMLKSENLLDRVPAT